MPSVPAAQIAVSAIAALDRKLDVTTNNIANANTDEFKKSRAIFQTKDVPGVSVTISEVDNPRHDAAKRPGVVQRGHGGGVRLPHCHRALRQREGDRNLRGDAEVPHRYPRVTEKQARSQQLLTISINANPHCSGLAPPFFSVPGGDAGIAFRYPRGDARTRPQIPTMAERKAQEITTLNPS